jgi:subtilisin-like proprotein convertase family protein
MKLLLTGAIAVGLSGTVMLATATESLAFAFSYTNSTAATIPDGNDGTSTPGVVSRDIVISDPGFISDLTVTITGLNHTYVGDLIATLTNVNTGTSVDLFNRIGRAAAPSYGNPFGDNSNFNGTYSFSNAFTADIWAAAAGGTTAFTVPAGDYFASTFKTSGATNVAPPSSLALFNGQSLSSTWRLTISDNAASDTGSFSGWTLSGQATPVPVPPQAVGTFLFAGLAAVKKRRSRKVAVGEGESSAN